MRQATLALTSTGAILVGGVATAQFAFSLGNPSDFATVTRYDGYPTKFGNALATVKMDDGAVAEHLVDTDEGNATVKYVTIQIGREVYTVYD